MTIKFFLNENSRKYEGQIYIDGHTVLDSSNWMQCLPWIGQPVRPVITNTSMAFDPLITDVSNFGVFVVGYMYSGALDEMRIYIKVSASLLTLKHFCSSFFYPSQSLSHAMIVSIGGSEFASEVEINVPALIAIAVFCAFVAFLALCFFAIRRLLFATQGEADPGM